MQDYVVLCHFSDIELILDLVVLWCFARQDYGPKVNFKRQKLNLEPFKGLPGFAESILDKIAAQPPLSDFQCVELCNLEYLPCRGSSIDAHIDDEWLWGERLITLNLASSTFLTLTPLEPVNCGAYATVKVKMPRRSLLVMGGDSRHIWKHAIDAADITARRVAMTFRELTEEFLTGGQRDVGRQLLEIARSFGG